ncbi:DNA-3-methyladenine glycosylase [Salinibacterium sp. SWN167]|uniref:DNA-3-methyladenine glycosylase n=1 Tax=Salinibacterium sp. SWN167 TaxID=2792054 RepID=UPI0018CE21CE|nr:DNA-3-methyladenine glycosylase [Salinibacterium sp. SWN167]MBH0084375.1 DNA-3-methyladenine glycosylase [Salinibacterium sp. SWN167]
MFELLSRPATEVAPLLLGAVVRVGEVAVRLTEVEAYLGEVDPGSHAFRGPGKRNAVMYGPPGHLYTYFTYGMHTCANVVCMPEGVASGILLRAGEVIEGMDVAAERRATSKKPADLARGPARLAVALGIRLDDAGTNLESGRVRLELPQSQSPFSVGPRTGVAGAGGTDEYPWRFWIPGEPSVSPYRPAVKRKRS